MIKSLSRAIILASILLCYNGLAAFKEIQTCRAISMSSAEAETNYHNHITLIKFDYIRFISITDKSSSTAKSEVNKAENSAFGEDTTSCYCVVHNSKINTTLTVLKELLKDTDKQIRLQIDGVAAPEKQAWTQTYSNTSVNISLAVAESNNLEGWYSVIIEVRGNFSNVTCTEPSGISTMGQSRDAQGGRPEEVFKGNAELLFETPLFILGAVMAVVGFLLMISGVAVLRRYRMERRQDAKKKKKQEMVELQDCNYEMVSNDESDCSDKITYKNTNSSRKASASSLIKIKQQKQERTSPSRHQSNAPADTLDIQPVPKRPSPGTCRYQNMSKKKRKHKMAKEKTQNSKNMADNDEDAYSSVELTYESMAQELYVSQTKRDTRIATPLVLLLNSGEKVHTLRKTEHLSDAQVKARSMPKMKWSEDNGEYSHLNRAGKSQSYHVTYDDASVYSSTDDTRCHYTAGAIRNSVNVFPFPKPTSLRQNQVTHKVMEDERKSSSVSSNQDEQDHIYEAVDKEIARTVHKQQSSESTRSCTEESKIEAFTQPKDVANNRQGANQPQITSVIQSDSVCPAGADDTVPKNETAVNKSDPSPNAQETLDTFGIEHEAVAKPEHLSVEEVSGDDLSAVNRIVPVRMPRRIERQNNILQNDDDFYKEVQTDILNNAISTPNCENFSNGQRTSDDLRDLSQKTLTEIVSYEPAGNKHIVSKECDSHNDNAIAKFPEEYVIIENILYETLPLSEPPKHEGEVRI